LWYRKFCKRIAIAFDTAKKRPACNNVVENRLEQYFDAHINLILKLLAFPKRGFQ
jgi:hypothetical protein